MSFQLAAVTNQIGMALDEAGVPAGSNIGCMGDFWCALEGWLSGLAMSFPNTAPP